ncbi:MAG: hypothetical protein PHS92_00620 [Candidatus Gracilibacteria bacterium]|nr:hypothetical protein [Candidatus Gracilibacteria bacterium]
MEKISKINIKKLIIAFTVAIIFYSQANAATCEIPSSGKWTVTSDCTFPTVGGGCKILGDIDVGASTVTVPANTTLGLDLSVNKITFTTGKILLDPTSKIKKDDALNICTNYCKAGSAVPCTVPVTSTYTVITTASGSAMGTITGGGIKDSGTTAVLTANTNSGYVFANWTGIICNEGQTSATCSFTVNSNVNAIGNFAQLTSTYPGCDTPDITLSNGQIWSACNVGTNISGLTSASYGTYHNFDAAQTQCASGYKLPSKADFQSAYDVYPNQTLGNANNLATKLILPLAGYYDAYYNYRGASGTFWSSTSYDSTNAYTLNFNGTFLDPAFNLNRSYQFSVRCIKDPVSYDYPPNIDRKLSEGYYVISSGNPNYPQGCNTAGLLNADTHCIAAFPNTDGLSTIYMSPYSKTNQFFTSLGGLDGWYIPPTLEAAMSYLGNIKYDAGWYSISYGPSGEDSRYLPSGEYDFGQATKLRLVYKELLPTCTLFVDNDPLKGTGLSCAYNSNNYSDGVWIDNYNYCLNGSVIQPYDSCICSESFCM